MQNILKQNLTETQLEEIYELSSNNKHDILESDAVGCFYCQEIFTASAVVEYVRSTADRTTKDCGICPNCGTDSLLPDKKVELSYNLLKELNFYAFADI